MGKWAMYRRRGSASPPAEPVLAESGAADCSVQEAMPTGFTRLAGKFTAQSNFTAILASLHLRRLAGFGQNVTLTIRSDQGDGNAPFAVLGTSTAVPAASIPLVLGPVNFSGFSVPLVNGTVYWLSIEVPVAIGAGELLWGGDASAGRLVAWSGAWTLLSNSRFRCFDLFRPG